MFKKGFRRVRVAVLVVTGMLAAVSLTALAPAPANAAPLQSGACDSFYVFIGVRGTNAPEGTGREVGGLTWSSGGHGQFVSDIALAMDNDPDLGSYMRTESLVYPAKAEINLVDNSNAYVTSRNEGVSNLTQVLEAYMACPTPPIIILAGYSQGADVIGTTLAEPGLSQNAKNHVVASVMFGDPGYVPNREINAPGMNFQGVGLWTRGDEVAARIDALKTYGYFPELGGEGWQNRVRSYCNDGDAVCQSNVAAGWPAHGQYGEHVIPAISYIKSFIIDFNFAATKSIG